MCDKKEEKRNCGDALIGLFSAIICEICLDFACKQHHLYIFYVGKLTRLVDELVIPLVKSLTLKCHDFSVDFNIMSALFAHQSLILPQKIDSREGLFRCKKGVVCGCNKMNIYLNKPRFAPILGLFAAKCSAIWYKTQCILVLNTVRFGAKCLAFWCKMECVLVPNARQNAAKCEMKSIKIH